jgi:hypothetical protein
MSQQDKVIQAQEFQVVDHEGRVRAAFGLDGDDSPGLDLFDRMGERRLSLLLADESSGILSFEGSPGLRVAIVSLANFSGLAMVDGGGARRAMLALNDRGDAFLQLCDQHGRPRLEVTVNRHGRPTVATISGSGRVRTL